MKSSAQTPQWYEKNERAGSFLLNLTILLVSILPRFLLRVVVAVVTFLYYANSKQERKNLRAFYRNIENFCAMDSNLESIVVSSTQTESSSKSCIKKQQKYGNFDVYVNFYAFGLAICDKIATWRGKITFDDLNIVNSTLLLEELVECERGSVLLMSHFGNIEVAHALSKKFKDLKITIFVYKRITNQFLEMLDKVSSVHIDRVFVNDIDIQKLLQLRQIIESGGHIAIMGDRVSLKSHRNVCVDFLGKPCYFPQGAYIIAGLLGAKMSMLWCEYYAHQYRVELEPLSWSLDNRNAVVEFGTNREKAICELVKKYAKSLENHACRNPHQWFSFYDFWGNEAQTGQK